MRIQTLAYFEYQWCDLEDVKLVRVIPTLDRSRVRRRHGDMVTVSLKADEDYTTEGHRRCAKDRVGDRVCRGGGLLWAW
jgi:hypothetical protein